MLTCVPSQLLHGLTDEQRMAVGSILEEEVWADGEAIVREGDRAEALFFIKSGEAVASRADALDTVVATMRVGDVFGESALQVVPPSDPHVTPHDPPNVTPERDSRTYVLTLRDPVNPT